MNKSSQEVINDIKNKDNKIDLGGLLNWKMRKKGQRELE